MGKHTVAQEIGVRVNIVPWNRQRSLLDFPPSSPGFSHAQSLANGFRCATRYPFQASFTPVTS